MLRIGTLVLAVLAACDFSLYIGAQVLTFRIEEGYSEGDVLSIAALASSPDGQDPIDTAIRLTAQRRGAPRGPVTMLRFTPLIRRPKRPRLSLSTITAARSAWSKGRRRRLLRLRR